MASNSYSIPRGVLLEGRVQKLLLNQGYFAVRNVFIPGHYQAKGASQPDIDVLGYLFTTDFTPTKVIYDCKSGSSQMVNRVLWFQTLSHRINANRSYIVKKDIKRDIKLYGLAENVHLLDYNALDELEKTIIDSSPILGSSRTEYLLASMEINRLQKNPAIRDALKVIRTDFWFQPSCSAIKRIIAQNERIGTLSTLPGLSPVGLQWLKAMLVSLFTLGILIICSEVSNLNTGERDELLKRRLVSDKIPYNEFTSLVRTTFEYAHSIYGGRQGLPLGTHYEVPPPEYTDSLLDLVNRALRNPKEAILMPRFSECILFDYVLSGTQINKPVIEAQFGVSFDKLLSHYRDYIFFLINICPNIRDFLKALLPT